MPLLVGVKSIPNWVHQTMLFQQAQLLNRGVLDAVGSTPFVLLARNPIEKKERWLDRSLVIGSAFFLAPLHGWLFLKLFSKNLPHSNLMRVPFSSLKSLAGFKQALKNVVNEIRLDSRNQNQWQIPKRVLTDKRYAETLRKQVMKSKLHMLQYDLITEAAIFANIGYIKNWALKKSTGRNQFTGEYGIASQNTLDNLKAYNAAKTKQSISENFKFYLNNLVAIVTPIATTAIIKKHLTQTKAKAGFQQWLGKNLHWFDYNKGIFMGLGAIGVVVAMQFLGALMAARDKYERREVFIRENLLNYIFFFGSWTWMKLAQKVMRLPNTFYLTQPLSQVLRLKQNQVHIPKAAINKAKSAAAFYWGCFAANTVCLAAVILGNNKLTHMVIKKDINKMQSEQLQPQVGFR